jgi:CubicO group peptidase (beta-lactamase class C family)
LLGADFRATCEAAAERWGVPALAVGIRLGDREGFACVGGCDADTLFRVASVTKPFTATLALSLLDLDASTGVWPDEVRVRHLLSHTSGFDCECGDLSRFGDGDDALSAVVRELPSVRRFVGVEEAWSYANTGYWLAGARAASAAGSTYEDALGAHVLEPARLEATSFGEPDVAGTGSDAGAARYPRARRPSGGLVSSVRDLLRFGAWQLAEARTNALRMPVAKPSGGVYGYGFAGERIGGVDVWGHGGSFGGYQSSFLLVPARDGVFAGLTNSGRGKQALREVENAFFELAVGARRRVAPAVELAADELEPLAGTYENGELRASVAVEPPALAVELVARGASAQEPEPPVTVRARAVGPRRFEIVDGDLVGDRFDFPLPRFARIGSRLAERVS